jgi:hypothetical protein
MGNGVKEVIGQRLFITRRQFAMPLFRNLDKNRTREGSKW